jgi:hypothetical protein
MWENMGGDSFDSRLLAEAIRATDEEIWDEAVNGFGGDREAHNDIVEDNSRAESWEGNPVDDDEMFREALGEIPAGMAGTAPTIGEEALSRENAELREHLAALQAQQPQPERPDLFQDPRAFEENILAQHRGGRFPVDHGTPLPDKPDPFADPQGYQQWMLNEMDRRAGVADHHEARVNSSLAAAAAVHGQAFEDAFREISSMDPRNPRAREAVQSIINSPDPGSALLSVHAMLRAGDEAGRQYGRGAPFAPMLPIQRSAGHGRSMQARGFSRDTEATYRSADHAEEDDVFNSVWDN